MASAKATFEEQLKELEAVVARLERGELSLEENVSLFERGVHLSNACKQQLAEAESRVQVLLEPEVEGPVRVGTVDVPEEDAFEDEEDEE